MLAESAEKNEAREESFLGYVSVALQGNARSLDSVRLRLSVLGMTDFWEGNSSGGVTQIREPSPAFAKNAIGWGTRAPEQRERHL